MNFNFKLLPSSSAPLSIQTDAGDIHAHKIGGKSTESPSRVDSRSHHIKRKQTLLTLLDALTELKLEEDKGSFGM